MLVGCLAMITGLFSVVPPSSAAASTSYTLYVGGKVLSTQYPTIVEKNVTIIPMKAVLTHLNYVTTLDTQKKTITAKNKAGSYITVKVGIKRATINGSEITLSALVKTMKGTTYIPLSAIRQLTGIAVGSDASQGIAWIGENPTVTAPVPTWGVTRDQLKTISGQKPLIEEGRQGDIISLLYQESPQDLEELYVFYKNRLAKVVFSPVITGYDEALLIEVYEGMLNSITNDYGKPDTETISVYEETLEQVPLADGGYITSEWNVGSTKMTLLLRGTDTGYALNLQYLDTLVESQLEAALDKIRKTSREEP